MKGITHNIAEMTDSREMLEAKTSPVITIFIGFVFVLLLGGLIWSYYGEIDEVARASGVVRPNEKVSMIQASSLGQVEYIQAQEGMPVKSGELLLKLKQDELTMELENRQADVKDVTREVELLQKYKESVRGLVNQFSEGNVEESYYYDLTQHFLLEYEKLQQDYRLSKRQNSSSLEGVVQSREKAALSIRASDQRWELDRQEAERKIAELTEQLQQERMLKASVLQGKDALSADDVKRREQWNAYRVKLEQLTQLAAERKAVYDRSVALGERFVAPAKLSEEKAQYDAALLQQEQFRPETLSGIENAIASYEQQLEEQKVNLTLLQANSGPQSAARESLLLEQSQLEENEHTLSEQAGILDQVEMTALNKFKFDRIVQINAMIEEREKKLESLQENVNQIRVAMDKNQFKAPVSGTLNVLREVSPGGIVQPGEALLAIIPSNESRYKISIAVPNHEIGKIALGDQVKLNFDAFPKQSFGSLSGTIISIGTDATVQENGMSYYVVEASLPNKPLKNRKGELGEIKVGMTAEAYVITDSKRIIHFLLEKINLRE